MATAAIPATRTNPLAWLGEFLKVELAPYPGRTALVGRMVLAASIVMLVDMIFRIPYGAYAALYALTISRENTDATLQDVRATVLGFAAAVAYALIGATVFVGEPVLRLVWVLGTFFVIFWTLSAVASYRAAARFGYLIAITIPLWDRIIPAEQKVEGTLWAIGSLSLSYVMTAALELIFARLTGLDIITTSIVHRLVCTAALLRSWSSGIPDRAQEKQLTRLAVLGTSRMRRDLLRSGYSPEVTQQIDAVVSLVGVLVDTGANLAQFPIEEWQLDSLRLSQLAKKIEGLADHLLHNGVSEPLELSGQETVATAVPLLQEMERTVSMIGEVLGGSELLARYRLLPAVVPSPKPFFVPDAFSSPRHVRFAIRGGLAASVCYLTYNLIAWPGISTAVTTCLLTALTTVGASRQKQALRFSGAVVGGAILGFGTQMFVLPALDSIAAFLVLFLAVTIPAAWIATSGPRLSYFGVQIALAFYLINLQEFRFQTSLAVARDRVVGILIGLLAMWLIFDQLWGASALIEMQRTFVSSVRLLSGLMREPASANIRVAIGRSSSLRESINANFDKLRQQADAIMLEFGPSREQNLAVRAQLVQWQLYLRIIFITRIALLKYRLRLPGFELPEPILNAQQIFDNQLADRLESIADHFQSNNPLPLQKSEPFLPSLANAVQDCSSTDPADPLATRLRTFLRLADRIESILGAMEREARTMSAQTE